MADFDAATYKPAGGGPLSDAATLERASLGLLGTDWIDDTSAHTGEWYAIFALTDATFATLRGDGIVVNGAATGNLDTKELAQGITLYAKRFTAITLSEGTVYAIKINPIAPVQA